MVFQPHALAKETQLSPLQVPALPPCPLLPPLRRGAELLGPAPGRNNSAGKLLSSSPRSTEEESRNAALRKQKFNQSRF